MGLAKPSEEVGALAALFAALVYGVGDGVEDGGADPGVVDKGVDALGGDGLGALEEKAVDGGGVLVILDISISVLIAI